MEANQICLIESGPEGRFIHEEELTSLIYQSRHVTAPPEQDKQKRKQCNTPANFTDIVNSIITKGLLR